MEEPVGPPQVTWNSDLGKFVSNVPIKWYAFVINGEVVFTQHIDMKLEYLTAVFSSRPQIIEIPEPYAGMVKEGWTWDESRGPNSFQPTDKAYGFEQ
jgi:hypothetical protein